MEGKSKVGAIAATVAGVAYVLSAVVLGLATATEDGDSTNDGSAVWVPWWLATGVGTIAVAVTIHAMLRRSGGLGGALPKVALGLAVVSALAAVGAPWAFLLWGIGLSVAALLTVFVLRSRDLGVAGAPSMWDWVIPVAFPLGTAVMFGLWASGVANQDNDGIDWGYAIGFSTAMLVTAAAMVPISRWLRSPQVEMPAVEGGVGSVWEPR